MRAPSRIAPTANHTSAIYKWQPIELAIEQDLLIALGEGGRVIIIGLDQLLEFVLLYPSLTLIIRCWTECVCVCVCCHMCARLVTAHRLARSAGFL